MSLKPRTAASGVMVAGAAVLTLVGAGWAAHEYFSLASGASGQDVVVAAQESAPPLPAQHEEMRAGEPAPAPPAPTPVAPRLTDVDEEAEVPSARLDVEHWVAKGDGSKLDTLMAMDVAKDLEASPAIISGLGHLAKTAAPAVRRRVAQRLGGILQSERARAEAQGRAAAGNVATGIDALGELGGAEAGVELTRALDTAAYALHHETRMVQELGKQAYVPARAAVERFLQRTKARRYEDSFDQELQKEALQAADETLSLLTR